MKKILLFLSFLLMSICGYGTTVTFTWGTNPSAYESGSSNFTEGDVTFTGTKGTGSTATRAWNDGLRMYAGSTAQFSVPEGYIITSISGYSTFNFTGNLQIVLFTDLTKTTCKSNVSVTYSGSSKYTITYDSNGGSGEQIKQTPNESSVKLYDNHYTKSGYIFDNWNTEQDGTGTNYDEGLLYSELKDIILYAKWLKSKYKQECDIFYEQFDTCKYGSEFSWDAKNTEINNEYFSDWYFVKAFESYGCIKLGNNSSKGIVETPSINNHGYNSLILSFKAACWNNSKENKYIVLFPTNCKIDEDTLELKIGEWKRYDIKISNISTDFKIRWESRDESSNRFFLDSICISSGETPIDIVTWYNDSIFLSKDYFNEIDFKADSIRIKPVQTKKKLYSMPDSTLKVDVDLSGSYCDTLHFIVCNNTEAIEQYIKVPHIIESTEVGIDTINNDSVCDVVVHSKLNINSNREKRNIIVYPKGILNIQENDTFTVNSLTLRRDNDSVPYLSYKGKLNITNGMFFELRTDAEDWRWLTLPDTFDTKIFKDNPEVIIKLYNGEIRAKNGRGGWKEPSYPYDTIFNPGSGFIFGIDIPSETEKRIYKIKLDTASLNRIYKVHVKDYSDLTNKGNDIGWNVIGNPYYTSLSNIDTIRYAVVKSYKDDPDIIAAGGYESLLMSEYDIKPFTSFFIQARVESDLIFDKSNLIFKAPKRTIDSESFLRINVGNRKTGCFVSNKFTDDYEPGDDLESNYSIYQLINGYKLLYSAINDSILEKGIDVYSPTGIVSIDEKTDINNFEEISVLYNNDWYNLLNVQSLEVSGHFILQAKRKDKNIATNIENIENKSDTYKVIKNNQVFIIKNNKTYNTLGICIK